MKNDSPFLKDLGRIGQRWHAFWFIPLDPFILGLFRLALGGYLLLYYFMLAPSWLAYYGPRGFSDRPVISLDQFNPLNNSFIQLINTESGMWCLYAISVICVLCFVLGYLRKFPLIWLWIMNFSLFSRNYIVYNSEEQVMAVTLLFSLFLPFHKTWTLPQLINKSQRQEIFKENKKITVWALRPLQIYIALIYALSFPGKVLSSIGWRDGTQVYYAMMAVTYPRWPGSEIFAWNNAIVSRLITFYTLVVEVLFSLFVWFRRFRVPLVCAALVFQLGLGILLEGVMMFSFAFFVSLLVFLPSRRTKEFFRDFQWPSFQALRFHMNGKSFTSPKIVAVLVILLSSFCFIIYAKHLTKDSILSTYYFDGKLKWRWTYRNGELHGISNYYSEEGILSYQEYFENGYYIYPTRRFP